MEYAYKTDIGLKREKNEDSCYVSDRFAIVADGMGGHNKGEVASKLAVENIISFLKENLLQDTSIKIDYVDDIIKQAYNNVNYIIHKKSIEDERCEGMGTTLTIAIIYEDNLYAATYSLVSEGKYNEATQYINELLRAQPSSEAVMTADINMLSVSGRAT